MFDRLIARAGLSLATVALLGCESVGPRTVQPDQFHYGNAIQVAASEQLLQNMVRLRYHDPPVFLAVSSVISQYRASANASLRAGIGTGVAEGDTGSVGVGAIWVDRPTITYTPVRGREFAKTLLTPLPIESIFELIRSGWPADLVVRLVFVSINGTTNEVTRPSRRQDADTDFWEVIDLWRRLRDHGGITTRVLQTGNDPHVQLILPSRNLTPQVTTEQARFRTLLGLEPGRDTFRVVRGLVPEAPDEIAVMTRSLRDIMESLAWRIHVPEEHVAQGRTAETFEGSAPSPLTVHHSRERPEFASVAARNRGEWFFIDDRDRASKRSFGFLHLLLSLAETPEPGRGPILTID